MNTGQVRETKGEVLSDYVLPLQDNQFTISELLAYLKKVYGSKLNGSEFTLENVLAWLVIGHMPECYGGHLISSIRMSGMRVLMINGLSREDMQYIDQAIQKSAQVKSLLEAHDVIHGHTTTIKTLAPSEIPKARRTRLYYQTAKLPVPKDVLPDNWRALGIKANQLVNIKKRRKKKK